MIHRRFDSDTPAVATLSITRRQQFADCLRKYTIVIDGSDSFVIRPGETVNVGLTPGRHQVVARIDWCSSNTVDIDAEQDSAHCFEVGSSLSGWKKFAVLAYITVCRDNYLYLTERPGNSSSSSFSKPTKDNFDWHDLS